MNIQGIGQSYSAYYTSFYSSSGTQSSQGSGFTPPAPPDAATIIENEDTNLDGVLSVKETRLTEDMFADADTDSDGTLTLEELEEMLANGPPAGMGGMGGGGSMGPEPMSIESIFETEDTDGDEKNSTEQTQAYSSTVTQDMAMKAYQQAIQSFLLSYSGENNSSGSPASVLNAVA
jgi:hypothetical protein